MITTIENSIQYVHVLIPLAIPKVYAYHVEKEHIDLIEIGKRVEVAIKQKRYAGLIVEVLDQFKGTYKTKPVISFLDNSALVNLEQINFWKWISEYYCCTMGEVMNVALPQGLKLSSETKLLLNQVDEEHMTELSDDEYLITEALTIQNEIPILDAQEILQKKSIYPTILSLLDKRILTIKEELKTGYKPKMVDHIRLTDKFHDQSNRVLELIEKSEKQIRLFLAYQSEDKGKHDWQIRAKICKLANVETAVVKSLEKKGIFEIGKKAISRIKEIDDSHKKAFSLSDAQSQALLEIENQFKEKNQVLLHGITGSGKTQVYIELIRKVIEKGGQVLYLLPEIGLTTQIVNRLRQVFGNQVGVYHSRLNNHERVEIWKKAKTDFKIILAARSGLFLPVENLKLIIVDEEHDASFKQNDPAPRYNARDAAVYLSGIKSIPLLLGTATPSLESYNNALNGRYGLVNLTERFGDAGLPEIEIVDLRKAKFPYKELSVFSKRLIEQLKATFQQNKQALIFQNRRGYAPIMRCVTCGWVAECISCDVRMTVHKYSSDLRCHYCGKRYAQPKQCPKCGSAEVLELGFGTEKIEKELIHIFPDIKVARLDYDTSKSKLAYLNIISSFEAGETNLLVGTQMITKGLDFDHVGLVAILNADQSLHFPDFRANERSFQLFTQVAGRAGRKDDLGKVLIQTYSPTHPVVLETIQNNFQRFQARELYERKRFLYPPFFNLIYLVFKHKKAQTVAEAAKYTAGNLKKKLGKRILGPTEPGISRIRNYYIQQICVKIERKKSVLSYVKQIILEEKIQLTQTPGFKSVRLNIDVDPY